MLVIMNEREIKEIKEKLTKCERELYVRQAEDLGHILFKTEKLLTEFRNQLNLLTLEFNKII